MSDSPIAKLLKASIQMNEMEIELARLRQLNAALSSENKMLREHFRRDFDLSCDDRPVSALLRRQAE